METGQTIHSNKIWRSRSISPAALFVHGTALAHKTNLLFVTRGLTSHGPCVQYIPPVLIGGERSQRTLPHPTVLRAWSAQSTSSQAQQLASTSPRRVVSLQIGPRWIVALCIERISCHFRKRLVANWNIFKSYLGPWWWLISPDMIWSLPTRQRPSDSSQSDKQAVHCSCSFWKKSARSTLATSLIRMTPANGNMLNSLCLNTYFW